MRRKPKYLDREVRRLREARKIWGDDAKPQRRLTGIVINGLTVWEESPLHDPLMKTLD